MIGEAYARRGDTHDYVREVDDEKKVTRFLVRKSAPAEKILATPMTVTAPCFHRTEWSLKLTCGYAVKTRLSTGSHSVVLADLPGRNDIRGSSGQLVRIV